MTQSNNNEFGDLYIRVKHDDWKRSKRINIDNGVTSATTNIMYCSYWGREEYPKVRKKVGTLQRECPDYTFEIIKTYK